MQDIAKIVDKNTITDREHEKLHRTLMKNNSDAVYFFSVTSFIYCGVKVS